MVRGICLRSEAIGIIILVRQAHSVISILTVVGVFQHGSVRSSVRIERCNGDGVGHVISIPH